MINFIYGRSASKKADELKKMIAADHKNGIRSFLIVPEQFAVYTERQMLRELPASLQLNLEILNFSRLYNRVCREYGGIEYNYITKPLKYAMMWQNLRELSPFLEVYGKHIENDTAICDIMLSAIGEFKAAGVSASSLELAASKLQKDSPLAQKLRDLALIYTSFNNAVSHAFCDSSDDLSKLVDILSKHDFFSGSNVYIDSFTSFTALEYKIIDKMFASALNVTVTIALDEPKSEAIYTRGIKECQSKLIKSAEEYGGYRDIIVEDTDSDQAPSIRYLANNLWLSNNSKDVTDDEGVNLIKCSSPYTEAEAAASTVLSLLREGYRCRDIVVLARDAEQYRGIIEPAFEKCDIPYYFSEKTDLSATPIVKFLLSALNVGIYNWRTSDVVTHLKYRLYDVDTQDIDLFEQYVTTWQIRGKKFTDGDFNMNPDGYAEEITERGERILLAANKVRALICTSLTTLFDELESSPSFLHKIRALYRFLENSGIKTRFVAMAKKEAERGNVRAAEDYSKLFSTTVNALAELAEAMSDEMCVDLSLVELRDLLYVYFSKTDMGAIPTAADQVTIGSASMLRAGEPRAALVLGLCEGVFPASVNDGGVLTFHEKAQLTELDINLSGDTQIVTSDELMYAQRAIQTPKDKLFMFTHTNSADGRASSPSFPFERAAKLFEGRVSIYDSTDIISHTPSLRTALQYLEGLSDPSLKNALTLCAMESDELRELIDRHSTPISDVECSVDPELAEKIFGSTVKLSQSKIDKFVNCKFSYYCTYVLKLREEQISRFKANDIGTFIHYILEKLLSRIVDENGINTSVENDSIREMVQEVVDEYIKRITPKNMQISARLSHLYKRLYKLSVLLVFNILEEFRHSSFRPEFFELETNGVGENPSQKELELSDGKKIIFSGIIDRVDILRHTDGKIYIRVVDYKTGTKEFSLEDVEHGLNIQMLLYLFTLTNNKNKKFKERIGTDSAEPAGVVYLSSNAPMLELSDYQNTDSVFKSAQKKLNRSGLLIYDEEILKAMNEDISPDFLAGVKKKADGTFSGKALATPELFLRLEEDIDRVIRKIAGEMLSGSADADPLIYNKRCPCDFCAMKPVCRKYTSSERR